MSQEERPAWAEEIEENVVDVREDLRAGREPFQAIMATAGRVASGQTFVVRATFEPKPLYGVLASQGFEAWPERLADDDWKVYFLKTPQRRGGCSCGGHGR